MRNIGWRAALVGSSCSDMVDTLAAGRDCNVFLGGVERQRRSSTQRSGALLACGRGCGRRTPLPAARPGLCIRLRVEPLGRLEVGPYVGRCRLTIAIAPEGCCRSSHEAYVV